MKNKILIVEDSKTISLYQQNSLKSIGIDSYIAHDFDQTKDILKDNYNEIFLAIVDINLPIYEDKVLDYLLKNNIPCIAMTGSFHSNLREKIIDKSLIDYIVLEDDQNLELMKSTVKRILNNKNTNVLVVDDSQSSRFALKRLLEQQNYNVLLASDPLEAISTLKTHDNIKLALIDYEMPHMNGAELTRIFRKSYSRMELAILAISVHTNPIITIEFLKAGANDFITKPYIKEEVNARISVNIDMIDQNTNLYNEIEKRTNIEKELELKNDTLNSIVKEMYDQKNDLIKLNKDLEIAKNISQNSSIQKSNFLASMSHEIRTPMNAIMGFLDLLIKDEDNEHKLDKLNIIKSSSSSLMTIINDILDFSKIEQGKLLIEQRRVEIKTVFEVTALLFEQKFNEKSISHKINLDNNLPQYIYSDETRIKQIYSNLISNAIKFSDEKSQIISTICVKDNLFECSVQDFGIGIEKASLNSVFNSFEQEDTSTTRKFGGTGLGLSISKALVELLGGNIKVQSEKGKGSIFTFTLPFKDICDDIDTFTQTNIDMQKSIESNTKILLVEDNKANQLFVEIILDEMGLDVDTVNNGQEAVDILLIQDYDLVLMDENMPILNGIEATKIIRENEERLGKPKTPIIAVTANALSGDRDRFLDSGMDDYITKPIDQDKLRVAMINQLYKS